VLGGSTGAGEGGEGAGAPVPRSGGGSTPIASASRAKAPANPSHPLAAGTARGLVPGAGGGVTVLLACRTSSAALVNLFSSASKSLMITPVPIGESVLEHQAGSVQVALHRPG